MKIICAGFPKTGSKSCSAALRVLGFKVADWLETAEYLGDTWIVGIPRKKCWAESSSMIIWESLKDRLFGRENWNQGRYSEIWWIGVWCESRYAWELSLGRTLFRKPQRIWVNFRWKELRWNPGQIRQKWTQKDTKVILTVRDSDEKWWKSWCGFTIQAIWLIVYYVTIITWRLLRTGYYIIV